MALDIGSLLPSTMSTVVGFTDGNGTNSKSTLYSDVSNVTSVSELIGSIQNNMVSLLQSYDTVANQRISSCAVTFTLTDKINGGNGNPAFGVLPIGATSPMAPYTRKTAIITVPDPKQPNSDFTGIDETNLIVQDFINTLKSLNTTPLSSLEPITTLLTEQ